MPTLAQQKVACFDFCNELEAEWGGFQGDDYEIRTLPFYKRQHGAEFLAMKVEGVIVSCFAAGWNTPRHFHDTALKFIENGIRLYVLDVGKEEITQSKMLMGLANVLAAKNPFVREKGVEHEWPPGSKAPLGWKRVQVGFRKGSKWKMVPDLKVRAIALRAYGYFMEGFGREEVHRKLRRARHIVSAWWCEDAFKAVVCGFPGDTHKVTEAFSGFSFRAWRQRDPEALALLSRIADTFQQERARLLESSALAQQLRPQLEECVSAAGVPRDQP